MRKVILGQEYGLSVMFFPLYFAVREILWGIKGELFSLSLSLSLYASTFHSLSLSMPISLNYLSFLLPFTSLSLSIFLSLFSLSFSLAYLMDVFVLVFKILPIPPFFVQDDSSVKEYVIYRFPYIRYLQLSWNVKKSIWNISKIFKKINDHNCNTKSQKFLRCL